MGNLSKYSYTYNRNAGPKPELRYYTRDELELMTTYQLRDICYRERIINGIHAPLDKDVLIREIMRFRGRADRLFITEPSEDGLERLESLLATAKLDLVDTALQGCAKLIVYHGISVEYFDRYTIGYMQELVDTNALLVSGGRFVLFSIFAPTRVSPESCSSQNPRRWSAGSLRSAIIPSTAWTASSPTSSTASIGGSPPSCRTTCASARSRS